MISSESLLLFETKENTNNLFEILKSEDFSFGLKDIKLQIEKKSNKIAVKVNVNTFQDLKISLNAVIKALELYEGTRRVIENEK